MVRIKRQNVARLGGDVNDIMAVDLAQHHRCRDVVIGPLVLGAVVNRFTDGATHQK